MPSVEDRNGLVATVPHGVYDFSGIYWNESHDFLQKISERWKVRNSYP